MHSVTTTVYIVACYIPITKSTRIKYWEFAKRASIIKRNSHSWNSSRGVSICSSRWPFKLAPRIFLNIYFRGTINFHFVTASDKTCNNRFIMFQKSQHEWSLIRKFTNQHMLVLEGTNTYFNDMPIILLRGKCLPVLRWVETILKQ